MYLPCRTSRTNPAMEEVILAEDYVKSAEGEASPGDSFVYVGEMASVAADAEERCVGDAAPLAAPAGDGFVDVCNEVPAGDCQSSIGTREIAPVDTACGGPDRQCRAAAATFTAQTRRAALGNAVASQASALGAVNRPGEVFDGQHVNIITVRTQHCPKVNGELLDCRTSYTSGRASYGQVTPSQPLSPLADSITEKPVRSVIAPDGFIRYEDQELYLFFIRPLRNAAVQGYLDFHTACAFGSLSDEAFQDINRPERWGFLGLGYDPRVYVQISESAAKDLTTICDAAIKQVYLHVLTVEVMDGFCGTLRSLVQPIMEKILSCSLQAIARLPEQTLAMLPSDQRAVLSVAFCNTIGLYADNSLTVESFNELCKAVVAALESVGRPAEPVAPYHGPVDMKEWLTDPEARFSFHNWRWVITDFEANTLTLTSLEYFVRHLNAKLNSEFSNQP